MRVSIQDACFFSCFFAYFFTLHWQWPQPFPALVIFRTSLKEEAPSFMASLISFFVTLKQGHRYFSPLISKHQGRGSVYSGCQFGIQHIEALGVMSEKLELTDQVLRIFFLLALFFYKPGLHAGAGQRHRIPCPACLWIPVISFHCYSADTG